MRARSGLTRGLVVAAAVGVVSVGAPAVPRAEATTAAGLAQAAYTRMSNAQRIGQLFMVGTPATGLSSAAATAIGKYHVGNVILTGRSTVGAAPIRALTTRLDRLATGSATAGVPLWISTDQEGGYVQVLQGSGFSRMPTALTMGTWSTTTLTSSARTWGRQLRRAGVDVNLAPVLDTVPAATASTNPPIGHWQREFGHTPSVVTTKGGAFLSGERSADLAMTAKHFPGLGYVTANTDTTAGVKDTVTTTSSGSIAPFRSAVSNGVPIVMMSSAVYTKIDGSRPAVFSPTVITGLLRHGLGFSGVVMSDDLGNAKAVAAWSAGDRAVRFIDAGGDEVLTVNASTIPAMVTAVTARAATDSSFRGKVATAVMRVLTAKAAEGLLGARLKLDGSLGAHTISALQRWLGVSVTGTLNPTTIRALQTRVGTTPDDVWGPASMRALQLYLGIATDGARTWNSRTVTQLQGYLNTQL
ncbi:glycoside hydrolase family 3 N-terminal domain-containing protein [Phycicoccus sp. Soil803]|uniref:glycoside hydrolase family 3 N-terminal domain-containing protein n=1 Tax=Phycicoccus sp. Soil803 TaxID=1736415 RepID=UPI0009EB4CFC|nr:glycoside hydrolase family 3 N-terminal domain-containing protein [Phycicoccus sp. Soil803]